MGLISTKFLHLRLTSDPFQGLIFLHSSLLYPKLGLRAKIWLLNAQTSTFLAIYFTSGKLPVDFQLTSSLSRLLLFESSQELLDKKYNFGGNGLILTKEGYFRLISGLTYQNYPVFVKIKRICGRNASYLVNKRYIRETSGLTF